MAQISASQCTNLATAPGFYLRDDAAKAWDRAVQEYGKTVLLTGAWRSYETQLRIFEERYDRGNLAGRRGYTNDVRWWPAKGSYYTRKEGTAAAAVPGTSNHGGGVAVDVKTSRSGGDKPYPQTVVFTSFNDPDRLAFLRVAGKHGWADDEGRSVGELWHLTYYPSRDKHKGESAKPGNTAPSKPSTPAKRKPTRLPTIKPGSKSAWVPVVQRLVGADDDGVWGPATTGKVKAFQGRHGLEKDGVVGLRTWTQFLYGHALQRGDRGDRVKVLQNMVGLSGRDADGVFGAKTHGRVVETQRGLGIGIDGVAGKEFRGAYLKHFGA